VSDGSLHQVGWSCIATRWESICAVLGRLGLDAAVIILDGQRNYWALQHRFHQPDGMGLMDGQLDFINAHRYGIEAADGQDDAPVLICHGCWGTVERWIWHSLNASRNAPPLWLAPTQLRLIPC
jgi:threonyl-tRNA synthetase